MSPLPDSVAVLLKANATAAMAAAFIIAGAHGDILRWVASTICGDGSPEPTPRANGAARRRPRKSNGVAHKPTTRDEADRRLLEAMQLSPGATIGELAAAIERSRTSAVTSLHRLRGAGLAESVEGKWRLTEPEAPRPPSPKWVDSMSGSRRAAHAHLTAS